MTDETHSAVAAQPKMVAGEEPVFEKLFGPSPRNPFMTALLSIAILLAVAGAATWIAGVATSSLRYASDAEKITGAVVQGTGVVFAIVAVFSFFLWLHARAISWTRAE